MTSLSELPEEKVNNIALTYALVYTSLLPKSKTKFENYHDFDIGQ